MRFVATWSALCPHVPPLPFPPPPPPFRNSRLLLACSFVAAINVLQVYCSVDVISHSRVINNFIASLLFRILLVTHTSRCPAQSICNNLTEFKVKPSLNGTGIKDDIGHFRR